MKLPLIVGNWKMHMNGVGAEALAVCIAQQADTRRVEVAVCPPFVYLPRVGQAIQSSDVRLGAQNSHFAPSGPFTGEISPTMLREMGCTYVILGHSERRQHCGESNELIRQKLGAVLEAGMTAIVCVGESLEERERGLTSQIVAGQMDGSVGTLRTDQLPRLVVAYEPIWAIGTGRTASPEQAQEVHADLRKWLAWRYNSDVAAATRILYGGSVKPDNAFSLLIQPDIDGALVGGASLVAADFLAIVAAAASLNKC